MNQTEKLVKDITKARQKLREEFEVMHKILLETTQKLDDYLEGMIPK